MGARHDWFVDNGTTPFTFAHGHVNATASQRWRTIMAYPDMCTVLGFNCSRLLYWANPQTKYLGFCGRGANCDGLQSWFFPGVPMGIAGGTSTACQLGNTAATNCDADDSRTLNNNALTIANFRQGGLNGADRAYSPRMERSFEVLAIILFGVFGLSHILQPKAWAEFFILLRGKGEPGALWTGFLNLPMAAIIIGFHNVWSGIPTVLTLVGWALLMKSLLRFCLPKQALKIMARVSVERSWEFQVAGAALMVLAGLLGYGIYAG